MQVIKIIPIKLKWSNWISWDCLKGYDIKVPKEAGVYEVTNKAIIV